MCVCKCAAVEKDELFLILLTYWVLGILEVEEETAVLILVLWIDVLVKVVKLLFNIVGNLFNLFLVQV